MKFGTDFGNFLDVEKYFLWWGVLTVFTITGRSGPGAHRLYFDYGTERWFGFAERVCADNDWLRNIRRKTGPFLVDMMSRGDIDIGVRIKDMARLVNRAMQRPVN